MDDKIRVLIVEDDRVIRNFITTMLNFNGYTVMHATNGKEAISIIASNITDLVLLDLGLPDIDGMDVLHNIRDWSEVPIIVVSSRQDENEKVNALDAGADDYITKPFGNSELLARIRTALRQHAKIKSNLDMPCNIFSVNGLKINYIRRLVYVDDNPVHLTPIEYRILVMLSRNAGKVLTHDNIIREIWGPYSNDRQILWVNMANIRRKIEPDPADPRYIFTQVGVGYCMADTEQL